MDTSASFDTFPLEADVADVADVADITMRTQMPQPLRPVLADEPMLVDEQTLTRRSDSTGRRVQADPNGGGGVQADPNGGGRVQTDANGRRVREQRGSATAPEAPLALFTEFNKKLIERLVVPNGAPHMMVEEYRKLAAALHHAQLAHGTKVIMVTSASPGEGKTLTASNLALTLSQSYQRHVLLIDADLRKPSVHDVFGVENAAGFIDALRESSDKTDRHVPLVQVSTRLELLLSGGVTPDPMSLLTSDALRALLKDAAETFDWVIVDSPPAAFLPDCNLMSSAVDATLIVVRAFVTPYPLVQRVVEAVGHDKVLGVVLNHAEQSPSSGYYGYGYGYNYGGYYGTLATTTPKQ